MNTSSKLLIEDSGKACFNRRTDQFSISNEEWSNANLNLGSNTGKFHVESLSVEIEFNVFLYDQGAKFILTDIDGTITQADISGHILPRLGLQAHHGNVIEFFEKVEQNGYQILYLTARSIALAESTKSYLFEVKSEYVIGITIM